MNRYTTPTIILTVQNVDLTGTDIYVTFAQPQSCYILTKTVGDGVTFTLDGDSNSVLSVYLDQEETAALAVGVARVQVNWITAGGVRSATGIKEIRVRPNLLEEVVEYGD